MKTLLLMRHAKSSWDDSSLPDSERPLNRRGERDAPQMGKLLREQGLIPDHVLTSAAVRARATAECVAAACNVSEHVTINEQLYHADVTEWHTAIEGLSQRWNCVLCVGHNPGLEEFIGSLTSQYVTMPTAAIAHLTCSAAGWPEFGRSERAVIQKVWRPKELK